MKPLINKKGITVRELKEKINNLPDVNPNTNEENEVWIEHSKGLSSPAISLFKLNQCDIILSIEQSE